MESINSDEVIKSLLVEKCQALGENLNAEVIMIRAPMASGIDDIVRREIDRISESDKKDQLAVVLETNGGSVEVVERISDVFRHNFDSVVFIVPNFAYSAGTVLTLSGDEIYMDYYSVLGPIDPQIRKNNSYLPGLGYLEKYNDLIEKSRQNQLTTAELEFLIAKFDAAELFLLEQAKKQSADLIRKWLPRYKFKNWNVKETSGDQVSEQDKENRAQEIADLLSDPTEWNSHGRGIPLKTLQSERMKLKIIDFGKEPDLNKAIQEYYGLFIDFCGKIGCELAIHTKLNFAPIRG